MVGEAWSVIAGKGSAFQDQSNPQVVVRVGAQGSQGTVEISDIIFSVRSWQLQPFSVTDIFFLKLDYRSWYGFRSVVSRSL